MKKNSNIKSNEKLAGLRVLIEHSFLLNTDEKQTLMTKLEMMKLSDIDALGQFLAWEKQTALASHKEITNLRTVLQK